jgi:hypothetical protein
VRISPTLIYLDLNKWIDLAKAAAGKSDGRKYQRALKTAEQLVSEGEAIFPLSSAHFMEAAKIGNDGQRRELAKLMVKLSKGWFLVSASYLLMSELRRAVASQFQQPFCEEAISPLSRSLSLAFITDAQLGNANFDDTMFRSPVMLEEFLATARVNRQFLDRLGSFAVEHESGRALRWDLTPEIRKRTYCAMVGLLFKIALLQCSKSLAFPWTSSSFWGRMDASNSWKECHSLMSRSICTSSEISIAIVRSL